MSEQDGIEKADGNAMNEIAAMSAEHEVPNLMFVRGVPFNPKTQTMSPDGTKVYNMLPSDPRMEKVHGELKYKTKETAADIKAKEQTDRITQLEATVNRLLVEKAIPQPTSAAQAQIPYHVLLKLAKRLDPTIKTRLPVDKLRAIVFGEEEENADS